MSDFNSRKVILAAGILSRLAGAAVAQMHLFGCHMPIADKPDF